MRTRYLGLIGAALVTVFLASSTAMDQKNDQGELALKAAIKTETVDGDLKSAIEQYKTITALPGASRAVVAQALVRLGQCYEKLGQREAQQAYERVVLEYADQSEAAKTARQRLAALSVAGGVAPDRTETAARRIWADSDWPESISPDGRYLVYEERSKPSLYIRDLQTGEQKRVTKEGSWAEVSVPGAGPALISPDGKQIAYSWYDNVNFELCVSAIDGSSMRVLRKDNAAEGYMELLAWMPDGRRVLTVSSDARFTSFRRHIISVPDGAILDIGNLGKRDLRAAVAGGSLSPDGRFLASHLNKAEDDSPLKRDITLLDLASEQESAFVENPADDAVVGWTPDGSGLVFASDRSGTRDLYLVGVEDGRPKGDPRLLRRDIGSRKDYFLARDGRLFGIEEISEDNSYIISLDARSGKATGEPILVDRNYPGAIWASWSSDGKLLYYKVNKGPDSDRTQVLVVRSEDTGKTREIVPHPKMLSWYRPLLSPDGRWFAVTGQDQASEGHPFGIFGIYKIDATSGEVSRLAKLPGGLEAIDPSQNWSPDGKAIYYKVNTGGKSIIRRTDLETGREIDVFSGFHARFMKLSPDGTRIVYYRDDQPSKSWVLGILNLQSGKELELSRVPEIGGPPFESPAWTPDGKHIIVTMNQKIGAEFRRFPAEGGPGEVLYFSPEWPWLVTAHPSGDRLAFFQSRESNEVWAYDNILPSAKAAR